MTVYSKINPESKNSRLKYLYIVAFLSGVVLWITSYGGPNINVLKSIKAQNESTEKLCTIETYNQGKWEYQPTDINPLTETGVAKAAGYHCLKKFAHRCFRRSGEPDEIKRAKAM
jgi:hypothetical protein